jgi:hypothetical protein
MDQNLDEKVGYPRTLVLALNITDGPLSQALRELEQELHTEIYPGTEIMTDVGSHHFVKAGTGAHSVLVPQPSDSEHDPLVSYNGY